MSTYKHYDFKCDSCSKEYRAGMWVSRDGVPEGAKCECGHLNMPVEKEQVPTIMIGTGGGEKGHDWVSKLPKDYVNFMTEFKSRHGRSSTIPDYKRGTTEY